MSRFDHTAFVNSRRDERSLGNHRLRAYAQDLRTFARFSKAHHLSDPLSKDDILAYHRHLRDELGAKPATIERRLVTLKSYFAWREDRNSALPSPFEDIRISVRIPQRLPRPIDRDTLSAVLQADERAIAAQSKRSADDAASVSQDGVTLLIIKLLIVTGLRISELTNLKVRDVSRDGGQILVQGKGSKERIVFVPNRELQEQFQRFCQRVLNTDLLPRRCSSTWPVAGSAPPPSASDCGRCRNVLASTPPDATPVPALGRDAADRRGTRHSHGSGAARACEPQDNRNICSGIEQCAQAGT